MFLHYQNNFCIIIIDGDYIYYFDTTMSREISLISKNIKKVSEQKCLLQDQIFKLTDISYNTVIKLESDGITNSSIDMLQKLAKALNVSVDVLLK